ncbi:MAG: ATPase [Verrucomicrobia bacterium]|nr:ATPase [Verrucomicrobiota bacterium]
MKARAENPARTRRDRLIHEMVHDPYKTKRKLSEPTVCPVCNAVFLNGRWRWVDSWPLSANKAICQACHRTKDDYPAGVLILTGPFVRTHKVELINLARHHEREENIEHPLHRIMRIEEHPDSLVIKTTDIHLPRRIADAVHHAYKGELDLHYDKEGYFARANWRYEQ